MIIFSLLEQIFLHVHEPLDDIKKKTIKWSHENENLSFSFQFYSTIIEQLENIMKWNFSCNLIRKIEIVTQESFLIVKQINVWFVRENKMSMWETQIENLNFTIIEQEKNEKIKNIVNLSVHSTMKLNKQISITKEKWAKEIYLNDTIFSMKFLLFYISIEWW